MRFLKFLQYFWCIFIGFCAIRNSIVMMLDPSGIPLHLDAYLPCFQVLPFNDIFFQDFFFPGLFLLIVCGITNLIALILLILKYKFAPQVCMLCGIILILWISIQFVILPFNWWSNAYFLMGVFQTLSGFLWLKFKKKCS